MTMVRRMFSEAEVLELHQEVLRIVVELDPPADLLQPVYSSVVAMVGQHEVHQPMLGMPAPPNGPLR